MRVDAAVAAITFRATAEQLSQLDLAYAPPYSAAMDNLLVAADVLKNKLNGQSRGISPMEVKRKLDAAEDFVFLDVRSPAEHAGGVLTWPYAVVQGRSRLRSVQDFTGPRSIRPTIEDKGGSAMKKERFICLAAALFFTLTTVAYGAGPGRGGGWGMGGSYQRMYNPATVETLTGTVESVQKTTPMKGMKYGIHLMVKTDKETIPVHLGPGWFIEQQDQQIAKGDSIEVKGSRVTMGGKPVIIAAEVKKGDQVLKLRDENGTPVWAGWRRP
ncbi:hypothetical protein LPW11_19200 [Geomonas sp. RF6]|uniref:hypothetical protein n=1 Tax=Geomonas sp. RF6 TaxID=2897342 RepID=UPI001E41D5FA|nr:hypothetical protein [Geomonas sp. RF6]UFS69996.1 hypothetical protein LPW11_19200 [Geomonas sp. RF6]